MAGFLTFLLILIDGIWAASILYLVIFGIAKFVRHREARRAEAEAQLRREAWMRAQCERYVR